MTLTLWSDTARAALAPPPRLSVSEWADAFRQVAPGTSPEPGPWRTSRVPYLREPMDACCDPGVERVVLKFGSQLAKALALDTPIPTPSGWSTMGDLCVGDYVFDERGAPTRIVAATEVMHDRPCYRVRFSDGAEIIADADHSWYVESDRPLGPSTYERRDTPLPGRRNGFSLVRRVAGPQAGILTTAEIAARVHWVSGGGRVTRNTFAVPVAKPLQLPAADLPIPPYALGVWLGDGHSYSAQITAARSDVEIMGHLRASGVSANLVGENTSGALSIRLILGGADGVRCKRGHVLVDVGKSKAGHCRRCAVENSQRWQRGVAPSAATRSPSFGERLASLGLIKGGNRNGRKHIPGAYLRASAAHRMELLRGLMDTDGTCGVNGRCAFVVTAPDLAAGMVELLISLGLKPTVAEVAPSCVYKGERRFGKKAWRIGFTAYAEAPVFHMARKRARLRGREGRRTTETERRRIVAVERVESVPVRCIQVDGQSRLYLAGRAMIPTHNSELLINVLGYYTDAQPSPILLVQPTEIAAQSFAKERVETTFRATPRLRGKLSDSLRDKDNTILLKVFPGGYLAFAWATSAVSLASRPIRIVLGDEIDRWPDSIGKDGDPWEQAVQRSANFPNRKIIAASTPTTDGRGISKLYAETDQRRFWVPCPRCGAYQVLRWAGVIYKRGEEVALDDVHYRCEHCDGRIEDREKFGMLAEGMWRAEAPQMPDRGYHLSALYSPFVKWTEMAKQWVKIHRDRDRRGHQEFTNLRLGEEWIEDAGASVNADVLEARREPYAAEVPESVLALTAGVDVQHNRLECEILGWGAGRETWAICYLIIPGDTGDLTSNASPWRRLDAELQRGRMRADGEALIPWCTAVDSGDGGRTDEVYRWCKERTARNVFATKGSSEAGRAIIAKPTTTRIGSLLYLIGTQTAKEALFAALAIGATGPNYCHFPRDPATGYDSEYYAGLLSERKKPVVRAGRKAYVWEQVRRRNEPLDCRVYAIAAMEIAQVPLDELAKRPRMTTATPAARPRAPAIVHRGVEV